MTPDEAIPAERAPETGEALHVGVAELYDDSRKLGTLHVDLWVAGSRWGGRVRGSDYLVWGSNYQRLQLRLPGDRRGEIVVRAGGRIIGLGPPP